MVPEPEPVPATSSARSVTKPTLSLALATVMLPFLEATTVKALPVMAEPAPCCTVPAAFTVTSPEVLLILARSAVPPDVIEMAPAPVW